MAKAATKPAGRVRRAPGDHPAVRGMTEEQAKASAAAVDEAAANLKRDTSATYVRHGAHSLSSGADDNVGANESPMPFARPYGSGPQSLNPETGKIMSAADRAKRDHSEAVKDEKAAA